MAAHLTIQIATNRRLKTRARQYARSSRRSNTMAHRYGIRSNRERFDFMEEVRAPRLEVGSSHELDYPETNSWTTPINNILRKKVLTMVNDKLIGEISEVVNRVTSNHDYLKEDGQRIIDFLNAHKGQRCYVKWC